MSPRKAPPKPKRMSVVLGVIYADASQEIDARDVAGDLDPDATDAQITSKIHEHLADALSDGPWPSFRARGVEDLVALVREVLIAPEED